MERKFVDIKIGDFRLDGVEAPVSWSDKAVGIAARTYFAPNEKSIFDMVDRVVYTIASKGKIEGYFNNSTFDYQDFVDNLSNILLEQKFAFNTPVWINVGRSHTPQAWACLIQGVEDDMESIENGWLIESKTFQGGSGSGVNVSKIRANGEALSGGGKGSGPISLWMQPTDAIAGVVKSGGRTRRAAKMVVMDDDHPDIMDFIWCKAKAETMAKDLQRLGYDIQMNGRDSQFIPFQQANNSVRISDKFMETLNNRDDHSYTFWRLKGRVDKSLDKNIDPKDIWNAIAQAAWECGDPGVQFHDTVNKWNPVLDGGGEIRATNPCGEYVFLDNTVCNLGSINLMAFYDENLKDDFNWEEFVRTIDIAVVAMDILVDLTSYPTSEIEETSRKYRTVGLGFTNLGALLMSRAIPYDSDKGRSVAAKISAIMQGEAIIISQKLASILGPYPEYFNNEFSQRNVIDLHKSAAVDTFPNDFEVLSVYSFFTEVPVRNAQFTVIAPTGTISFLMDCETTGIEPVLDIEAEKVLVGGGKLDVGVKDCFESAFYRLKVGNQTIEEVVETHPKVFETALGDNAVSPEGHVLMMAAVQPFISGGISKTCNLPNSATVDDIQDIYQLAYEKGLKAIAVYRDGCKSYQPMSGKKKASDVPMIEVESASPENSRKRPPTTRVGKTTKFEIQGVEYYVTVNRYEDGDPCEVFIRSNKHGSEVAGWVDAFSIILSKAIQYGVPIDDIIKTFKRFNFVPQGLVVSDSDIHFAESPLDFIVRWLELEEKARSTVSVDVLSGAGGSGGAGSSGNIMLLESSTTIVYSESYGDCASCGGRTRRAGSCMVCEDCGETTGCS